MTVDRQLTVLMIAPTSFFSDYGCHVRILEEIRALQRLGHRVTLCTYHNGSDVPGIDIRRTIDIPWRKRLIVGSSKHKLYLDAALSVRTLRAALAVRPDVIHAHLHEGALIGGVLARLLRRPLIFDYQGSLTAEMIDHGFLRPGGVLEPVVRRLERSINRLPDLLLTSSANGQLQVQELASRLPVLTLADAVDTDRFAPGAVPEEELRALRRQLGIPTDARVVTYLGLLAPYQGTDILLEAAARVTAEIPEAFFLLMGFPGVERYSKLARDLGVARRASFPGRIPYVDAHRYLALGDVAVAPKLSLTEGNGKIYNYLSMGLPVVAFDLPANHEIMGDAGLFARYGDADDLARLIVQLLREPGPAAELGRRGRERAVQHLSWSTRASELAAAYELALAPGRAPKAVVPSRSLPTPDGRSGRRSPSPVERAAYPDVEGSPGPSPRR